MNPNIGPKIRPLWLQGVPVCSSACPSHAAVSLPTGQRVGSVCGAWRRPCAWWRGPGTLCTPAVRTMSAVIVAGQERGERERA